MSDRWTLWRVGLVARENVAAFSFLAFLVGVVFTFGACSPHMQNPETVGCYK
jgi:hypothetical protein